MAHLFLGPVIGFVAWGRRKISPFCMGAKRASKSRQAVCFLRPDRGCYGKSPTGRGPWDAAGFPACNGRGYSGPRKSVACL